MRKQLMIKHFFNFIISVGLIIQPSFVLAANPSVSERVDWNLVETNTSVSDKPSALKFFKYYDVLPDDITLPVYKNMQASAIGGKKLFVGYGVANPNDSECRYFPDLNRTECFPWWRIEREYSIPNSTASGLASFVKSIPLIYPPKNVNYCKTWKTAEYLEGGQVTCTSYYDMRMSVECLANPRQSQCLVDQCSDGIKQRCSLVGTQDGLVTTLPTPVSNLGSAPVAAQTKVDLKTYQYNCPSGYMPLKECNDWLYGAMYPYECKPRSSDTANDGEYIYCNSNANPLYDGSAKLIGFTSDEKCSDGRAMNGQMGSNGLQQMCPVDNYQQTQKVCDDPIYQAETNTTSQTITQVRTFHDTEVDVLFGDETGDILAANPMCLRLNTVEGAREKSLSVRMVGSGYLDDDIYVLRHQEGNGVNKVYCNMQHDSDANSLRTWSYTHSGFTTTGTKTITIKTTDDMNISTTTNRTITVLNSGAVSTTTDIPDKVNKNTPFNIAWGTSLSTVKLEINFGSGFINITTKNDNTTSTATKNYNGITLSCLRNNGLYSFDNTISILSSDVVSIQQASEAEYANPTPFSIGRNHYISSVVTIDGVVVAPQTYVGDYPFYPGGSYLATWDNTLGSLSLLFPFAGAYDIFFYGGASDNENKLIAKSTITTDDFKQISDSNPLQLKLGAAMQLANGVTDNAQACRLDDWVEWGGGVYGGRASKTGTACSSPVDSFVKNNSVYKIIVKDLLTGTITPVPLVYPLAYPNRIYVSKLNVREKRKYRCFDNFPVLTFSSNCSIFAQNEGTPISDYRGMSVNQKRFTTSSCETTTQKIIGCNKESTVINSASIKYGEYNEFETNDYSKAFMDGLNQAKLAESMLHIWSGWPGECEKGIFTDFSWTSDPLTLASLAMSAYSSMNAGAAAASKTGETANAAAAKASDASAAAAAAGDTVEAARQAAEVARQVDIMNNAYSSLSVTLKTMLDNGLNSVIGAFTETANAATEAASKTATSIANGTSDAVNSLPGATVAQAAVKEGAQAIVAAKDATIEVAQNVKDYTYGVSDAMKSTEETIANLKNAIATTSNAAIKESLQAGLVEQTAKLESLQSSISGQIAGLSDKATTTIKSLFSGTSSTTTISSGIAEDTLKIQLTGVQGSVKDQASLAKEIYDKAMAFKNLEVVEGYSSITWGAIASASLTGYLNVAAKQDELVRAYKSQLAYVMSGEGTVSDVSANAYATCMASVGASFVNVISRSVGASDTNTTSQELLTPWQNPLRISFLSLLELRAAVGQAYVDSFYKVKDVDPNMQMMTIVALNTQAYGQLTQIVCGGYITSAVANTMNHDAAKNGGLLDALSAMSDMEKAKMAASMACALAGPYAFACSLGMKLLSSFSSGDACTDEKIAMSKSATMLKTNKFQKFGQCHHKGGECAEKWFLVGCIRQREKYCCYDQIATRIYAEGVKEQRGYGWESCNDITINDLQYISFVPCTPTQNPKADRCFPLAKYQELGRELKKQIRKGIAADADNMMKQVQNAMEVVQ